MKELTTEDFHGAISKGKTIVDFWAPWCGPCRMMAPVFEEASKGHKDIQFAKVNVDEHPEVAQEYGVRGIPTVIFFSDGEEVGRQVGMVNKPVLEMRIKENFT